MKTLHFFGAIVLAIAGLTATSCSEGKSYAELLSEEDMYTNNFLADQIVELDIPSDTVFKVGPRAPYYRLDKDGMMYMQVLKAGTPGNRVADDEQIYFRYTRYRLADYSRGKLPNGSGNNISLSPAWFRYNNFQLNNSYQWGQGVQVPLRYLPVDAEVNIVIKSQMGPVNENTNVQPFLWHLTYERRK